MAKTCDECGFVNGYHTSTCISQKCYACGSYGGQHFKACPAPANPMNQKAQHAKVQQQLQNQYAQGALAAGYGGSASPLKKAIAKGVPKNLTMKYPDPPETAAERRERLANWREQQLNLFIKHFPVFTALELMCPKCAQQIKVHYSLVDGIEIVDPVNLDIAECELPKFRATFRCHGDSIDFDSHYAETMPWNKWEMVHITRKKFLDE